MKLALAHSDSAAAAVDRRSLAGAIEAAFELDLCPRFVVFVAVAAAA